MLTRMREVNTADEEEGEDEDGEAAKEVQQKQMTNKATALKKTKRPKLIF